MIIWSPLWVGNPSRIPASHGAWHCAGADWPPETAVGCAELASLQKLSAIFHVISEPFSDSKRLSLFSCEIRIFPTLTHLLKCSRYTRR